MKKYLNEKTVLFAVMAVLTLISLIAASIAWFTNNSKSTLSVGQVSVAADRNIKVALTPGGEDIENLDPVDAIIDLGLNDFTNIEPGKLAPGTYGQFSIYVTSLSETVTGYHLSLSYLFNENTELSTVSDEIDFMKLLESHLLFSTDADFKSLLSADSVISGSLTINQEKEIIVYWKWPYEFEENPDSTLDTAELESMKENYDEEDSIIGKYIQNISFQLNVEGYQVPPIIQ